MPVKTRKREYREREFQSDFGRWARHNVPFSAAFELKVTEGNSLPFAAVQEHQENALRVAKHGTLFYKIADDSVGQKPFDCFTLAGVPAYVVIMFRAKDRDQRKFFLVDIDAWDLERDSSARRSLTEERAAEIGISRTLLEILPL